jgi:uncharacterized protein YkwD
MKSFIKSIIITVLVSICGIASAQFERFEEAVESGNFKRLEKLCEDKAEDNELKKDPRLYYYTAQAYVELSKDEFYLSKNPDAVKNATRAMLKGLKKDDNNSAVEEFLGVRSDVVIANNKVALSEYNSNKMAKAANLFAESYSIDTLNRYSYFMVGKCTIAAGDTAEGEVYYRNLIHLYNDDLTADNNTGEKEIDPHTYFINKFWEGGKLDSAKIMIADGRAIFGNNAKLNFYHKKVTLEQIKNIPPSNLMLEYVQEVLQFSPADKDLLQKENSIYIFLIKNKLQEPSKVEGDSLINKFVTEKVAKAGLTQANKIAEVDIFVEKKPENVLWKLAEYFQSNSHIEGAKFILDKYIVLTAQSTSASDLALRWNAITNYAFDTKGFAFGGFVLQQAISKYPNNKELKDTRTQAIAKKEVMATSVEEQGALYLLMKDEYKANKNDESLKKLILINDKYVGQLAANNRFSTVKDVMKEQMSYAPTKDYSDRLRYLAREDFYQNYFMSRTKGTDINGKEIQPFTWNGDKATCNPGEIDLEIQEKVANRINYFRRNAGLSEVLFDENTNEYCQKAALMMDVNKALEHDPPATWRCWTNEGNYAAKHSLLIKDANTSMAVTYIMDDKSPSAGNRRWLLYPNGRIYGHGSTNDYAVIWALDDSGATDTTQFMDVPVCWPPKGDVPQLMLLTNWSFSIYRDLTNAKVDVKQDGKPLVVSVEKFVRGYGAPTLVFQPKFDKTALPDKSNFDVTVTLSSGRKYNYTVRTFFYDPARR